MQHGVAADLPEAAALALKAGVDIDMMADAYRVGCLWRCERGLVSIDGDRRVRCGVCCSSSSGSACSIDPYRRGASPSSAAASARRRRLARDRRGARHRDAQERRRRAAAGRIGAPRWRSSARWPTPPTRCAARGRAAGQPDDHVSVLAGLRAALPAGGDFCTPPGVDDRRRRQRRYRRGARAVCSAPMPLCCASAKAPTMSGEAASRARPGSARAAARARGSGPRARAGARHAGDRHAVLRTAAGDSVARRAGRRGARRLVSSAARPAMPSPMC